MTSNYRRGADGERTVADYLQRNFTNHNVRRIGGIEKHKWALPGDIGCIMYDKGVQMCDEEDCFFQDLYFEIKKHKVLRRPSWWRKTQDDCPLNRLPILVYYDKKKSMWYCQWLRDDGYFTLEELVERLKVMYEEE